MEYVLNLMTLIAVWVIAVQGYMLIKGLGGLLHLGHPVFYGLGAYTAAILSRRLLPPGTYPVDLLLSALVAVVGAFAIGWPALRARGRYFMLVTFSVQLMFFTLVSNLHGLTGGPDGITRIPRFALGPWTITTAAVTLLFVCGLAASSYVFCHFLIRSPYGRLVRAVRDDEIAVEAFGKDPLWAKLSIFAIGAGVTGAAGSVFAHYLRYVGPTQFGLDLVMLFLVMLVLGGQYNLAGVTVGAVVVGAMIEGLRFAPLPHEVSAYLHQVIFGILLVAILFVRPDGLFPEQFARYRRRGMSEHHPVMTKRWDLLPTSRHEDGLRPSGDADAAILEARGLVKHFGGVAAVDGCDLALAPGRITAVIGPNGAGKTTIFNLLTGFVPPDAGRVVFQGREITGWTPSAIARVGVGRTFQDVRIWPRLTVIENVLVAMPAQLGERPLLVWPVIPAVSRQERDNLEAAWRLLERFGLEPKANESGSALSYAQQKMLSLARLTALDASVMLLDEPTAGVDIRRLAVFLDHIRAFAVEQGRTVCLIEHNMDVVRELADWVLFMNEGRVVASGSPQDVLGDRHLMSIYLGYSKVEP